MAVGKILRFDDVRGYGFIAAASGGEDVFVHANDFGEHRHRIHTGMRVEYETEVGERGLKVSSIKILDPLPSAPSFATGSEPRVERRSQAVASGDDELCDVLTAGAFVRELTEVLIQHVPSLTGAQILQLRQHLTDHARSHGWVET